MKKTCLFPVILAFFISCNYRETIRGNGNITTESRAVSNFKGIQLRGSMNVHLVKDAGYAVEIEAEENIIPYIETYVNDGKLIVRYKDDVNINNRRDVTVTVALPELEEAGITGSGDITGETKFTGNDEIELEITGSGSMRLNVDAPAIEAKITGSGDMYLSGNTRDIKCSSTGSGKIDAGELKSENAVVKTMGSGNIHVFASVTVNATINGSGDITYKGGGAVSSKIHGSGSVK
ncbi:MAG TPA: head GIN domain-containing protein, partial [Agriterribacter sp.]|nr:head GIN domain-containing protein [Agriterribacter sp.]